MILITTNENEQINLSPGRHSKLIKEIIEKFAPRFLSGSTLLYVSNAGDKCSYSDNEAFEKLGFKINEHDKMPDVIFYHPDKKLLILVESVTSHGQTSHVHFDNKRQLELRELFKTDLKMVFISAFPNKQTFSRFCPEIAWETNVWISDHPTHMIHFNGDKFLG